MSGAWRGWRRQVAARLAHAAWRRFQLAGMITAETDAGRRFAAFGPGSMIAFPSGAIFGERWIEVGDRTLIGEQVSVSAGMMPGHELGPDPVLRIGSGCVIGRGSHIVAHHSIDIGDEVYTGPYVYITDQNHSYADPDLPVGRQWPLNSAVRIGAGSWLGTGVIVLPGSVLGRNVVVAAGSVVRGEFADHCMIAGVPARVVKDFDPESGWTRLRAEVAGADTGTGPDLRDAHGRCIGPDDGADSVVREALKSVAEAMAADPLLTSVPLTSPATSGPPVAGISAGVPAAAAPARGPRTGDPDPGTPSPADPAAADSVPHPEPGPGG